MKRQIKFRGKDIKTGQWVYGSLICGTDLSGKPFYQIENADANEWRQWSVDGNTVGQFSGLSCKDGKEIYEGDIVSSGSTGRKYVIEYSDGKYRAKHSLIGLDIFLSAAFLHNKTVVGNVHDNINLLSYDE